MRVRSPRRRALSRSCRLVAAAVVLAAVGAALTPLAASGHPRAADAPDAAAVEVTLFSPDVGRPGGRLSIAGTVHAGADSLDDAAVRVRVSGVPVATRAELDALATGTQSREGVAAVIDEPVADLDGGASAPWSGAVELDSLALPAAGVYPVEVALESTSTGESLAEVTTFLSWFPTGTFGVPTKVTWLVPLTATPARDADDVFVNDRAALAMAPGGRLRSVLAAAEGTPAGWLVDGELLESAEDMADGYTLLGEDGTERAAGASSASAAGSFLTEARRVLADADVSALAYADPDVTALQRADLAEDITLATTTGPTVTAAALRRTVRRDLAAPPGGAANRSTLATLRAAGVRDVVLSDQALPLDPAVPYTPTGLARVPVAGGAVTAVLADTTLSAVVADPAAQGGDALARARYLAETLVITQQRPSDSRTVVVAAPRQWDVDTAFARSVLTAGTRTPWLRDAPLPELLATDPPDVARGPLTVPDEAADDELSTAQTTGARALLEGTTTFTGVLLDPEATAVRYTSARLRTESGAFRTQRGAGAELLRAVTANLDRDRAKVRVLSRGTVTLSGANGQVPVTVANDLDQTVVVQVRLVPATPVKLRVDQPGELRLGPRKKETIEVAARAATGGTVPVEVRLLTRDGALYDEPVTIQVRSTAYSRVALVVVGGAFVALLALVTIRLVRRVRRVRRQARSTA